MGIATLGRWAAIDGRTGVADPLGRPPLRPFPDVETLAARAEGIFARLDPVSGARFRMMRENGLRHLGTPPGKLPGGDRTAAPCRRLPFVSLYSPRVAAYTPPHLPAV